MARGRRDRDRVKEKRFRLWLVEHEKVLSAAIRIQRVARGKAGRIAARATLYRRVHAINIQRVWRGYFARKDLLNIYALRYDPLKHRNLQGVCHCGTAQVASIVTSIPFGCLLLCVDSIQCWYRGIVDRIYVEDLKLERAEEAAHRQNREDEFVEAEGANTDGSLCRRKRL